MKKVIIIGGGIAGLSAGIYSLKRGFDVTIYEKNPLPGGECTGWDRQGYHIDNCIHWLTGCKPGEELYDIWREIGAIADDTELYREPYFYRYERDGRALHFWRDIERAREEFLAAAPEDREEINKFFDCVRLSEAVKLPCEKSLADMNFIEYMKFGMTMAEMGRVIKEYGGDTVESLSKRFTSPLVREAVGCYMHGRYKAVALISSCGFYTSGGAAIPMGGSVGMARRISEKFREMGGKLFTSSPVTGINIEGDRARSVTLTDGSNVSCDAVICAADTAVTFGKLLDRKYMDKALRKMYEQPEGYKVSSAFNVSFGIKGSEECGLMTGSSVYPCKPFSVGTSSFDKLGIRLYDYDPELFPGDRRVIQCNIPQEEADYEYWNNLYGDKKRYNEEKARAAQVIRDRITELFPELSGRLILLDTYSPCTFNKWCGAYKGAYMSFFEQKGYKSLTAKNRIKGLSNVFLASQWLTVNGGLPIAVTSGKFAAECIGET